jgi:hypothetical protein
MAKVLYMDDSKYELETAKADINDSSQNAGPNDKPIELTIQQIEDARLPFGDNVVNMVKAFDAVVLDHYWGNRSINGLSYAHHLRNKGFKGPIIIYSSESQEEIMGGYSESDNAGLVFCKKISGKENKDNLYNTLQQVFRIPPEVSR